MDVEQVASRTSDSLSGSLAGSCRSVASQIAPYCESEIEAMLACAIIVGLKLSGSIDGTCMITVCSQSEMPKSDTLLTLAPQYKWNNYRIDWAVQLKGEKKNTSDLFFIECDGHDFHERTKEQAERDRRKDRLIQQAGIPIMRFTGREIYRSPAACATQVIDFIAARIAMGKA